MRSKQLFLLLSLFICVTLQAQVEETNTFVNAFISGDFATAYQLFDTAISKKLPPNQMSVIWSGLQTQAGKYKNHGDTRLEEQTTYTAMEFENVTLDLKLVFTNRKKIEGFFFVPAKLTAAYQKPGYDVPATYVSKDIVVKTATYSLPGILTLPANKTHVPLIILVHGSGPGDKDESVGANKIFRDLAVGLASNGIATLRYDKRTKVYATQLKPDSITIYEEVIDDAVSAVGLGATFTEINTSEIYVLGHSMGGMAAPAIAAKAEHVKGIILLAANARPLQDLLLEQTNYIFSLDSLTTAEKKQLDILKRQIEASKRSDLTTAMLPNELPMNVPASYWISLNHYHPLETASMLKQRMLILQGERDYQVTMQDFALWKNQLNSNKNVNFKSYPKLNHLFIEGETKSVPKEYETAGNVASYVIKDISDWINH